jgi:hypothetical protein
MLVEDQVIIENKTVEKILPIHEAQLLTYLKLTGCKIGFLINWNALLLKNGLRHRVNNLQSPSRASHLRGSSSFGLHPFPLASKKTLSALPSLAVQAFPFSTTQKCDNPKPRAGVCSNHCVILRIAFPAAGLRAIILS